MISCIIQVCNSYVAVYLKIVCVLKGKLVCVFVWYAGYSPLKLVFERTLNLAVSWSNFFNT